MEHSLIFDKMQACRQNYIHFGCNDGGGFAQYNIYGLSIFLGMVAHGIWAEIPFAPLPPCPGVPDTEQYGGVKYVIPTLRYSFFPDFW